MSVVSAVQVKTTDGSFCGYAYFLIQRDGRRREFNLPKIIAAQKFQGHTHIFTAACNFPIDHPRPDALASLRADDKHFVSNFEAMTTNDGAAILA